MILIIIHQTKANYFTSSLLFVQQGHNKTNDCNFSFSSQTVNFFTYKENEVKENARG